MVMKARETKRYEFEAMNSEQAFEIIHKIVMLVYFDLLVVAYVDECVQQDVENLRDAMRIWQEF